MPILFECLECNTTTEVDDDLAGKTIRCRECHSFGRVPVPAPKKKPREIAPPPPAPIFTYRCPFCQSTNRPVGKLYWTPASTLVWLVLWPAMLIPAWGICAAAYFALTGSVSGTVTAPLFLAAGVVLFVAVVAVQGRLTNSGFIKEKRKTCPDCDVRVD
jgi:hypothetical protein